MRFVVTVLFQAWSTQQVLLVSHTIFGCQFGDYFPLKKAAKPPFSLSTDLEPLLVSSLQCRPCRSRPENKLWILEYIKYGEGSYTHTQTVRVDNIGRREGTAWSQTCLEIWAPFPITVGWTTICQDLQRWATCTAFSPASQGYSYANNDTPDRLFPQIHRIYFTYW